MIGELVGRNPRRDRSSHGRAWPMVVVLLVWGIATLVNLGKAFHIDDTAHLLIAQWIQQNPLRPMSGPLNWVGIEEPIFATNQPHLFYYVLAAWLSVAPTSEVSAHVLQAVFALAALLLFHGIAARLAPGFALWSTALLALGPAFLVGQNVMVDTVLLAVWLAFMRSLLMADAAPASRRFVLMGVWAAVACLIKYSSLVLVAVLVVAVVIERRYRLAWVLLIPVGVLVAWSLFNIRDYGAVHILSRDSSAAPIGANAFRWVLTVGGVLPLGLLIVANAASTRWAWTRHLWWASAAAAGLLAVGILRGVLPDGLADRVLLAGFLVNGVVVVAWLGMLAARHVRTATAGPAGPSRLVDLYLFALVAATAAFYVLFSPSMAVRHVLPAIPALLLLFARHQAPMLARPVLAGGLIVSLVVGAGLAASDWRFADLYRRMAPAIAQDLPADATVWTTGHWGWQWYAGRVGMKQLDVSVNTLAAGDYLVVPRDVTDQPLAFEVDAVVEREIKGGVDGLSLFCTGRRARFYTTSKWGPWSISRECTGSFTVYRVVGPEP